MKHESKMNPVVLGQGLGLGSGDMSEALLVDCEVGISSDGVYAESAVDNMVNKVAAGDQFHHHQQLSIGNSGHRSTVGGAGHGNSSSSGSKNENGDNSKNNNFSGSSSSSSCNINRAGDGAGLIVSGEEEATTNPLHQTCYNPPSSSSAGVLVPSNEISKEEPDEYSSPEWQLIPSAFVCPLSTYIMRHPVRILQTLALVERNELLMYMELRRSATKNCPKTGVRLNEPITWLADTEMRGLIEEFLMNKPEYNNSRFLYPDIPFEESKKMRQQEVADGHINGNLNDRRDTNNTVDENDGVEARNGFICCCSNEYIAYAMICGCSITGLVFALLYL
jgi:hypothetical protein